MIEMLKLMEIKPIDLNSEQKEYLYKKIDKFTDEFLTEHFPFLYKRPKIINILDNKEMNLHFSVNGWYTPGKETIGISKTLAQVAIETNNFNFIEQTLKHELIHFALHKLFPETDFYRDGNSVFEYHLQKHGLLSNFGDIGTGYSIHISKQILSRKIKIYLLTNNLDLNQRMELITNHFSKK